MSLEQTVQAKCYENCRRTDLCFLGDIRGYLWATAHTRTNILNARQIAAISGAMI